MRGELLDEDLPDEEVDAQLRALGADPAALRSRGAAQAAALLEERRLSWRARADANTAAFHGVDDGALDVDALTDDEVDRELERMRTRAHVGGAVEMLFRKREAVVSTPAERRERLRQARRLGRLTEAKGEDGEP